MPSSLGWAEAKLSDQADRCSELDVFLPSRGQPPLSSLDGMANVSRDEGWVINGAYVRIFVKCVPDALPELEGEIRAGENQGRDRDGIQDVSRRSKAEKVSYSR
jgi:hypothetical protein